MVEGVNDSYVKICLDPVNNLAKGEGTHEVISALGNHTVNFHCKDYTVKRKWGGLGFDVEGCVAGEGLLDLELVQATLKGCNSCTLERWTPWQGDNDSTRKLESEWVVRSVANLKKTIN